MKRTSGLCLTAGLILAVVFLFQLSTSASDKHRLRSPLQKTSRPILHKNCAACHRTGEIAPMSLLSYKDVRPWAKIDSRSGGRTANAALACGSALRRIRQRPPPLAKGDRYHRRLGRWRRERRRREGHAACAEFPDRRLEAWQPDVMLVDDRGGERARRWCRGLQTFCRADQLHRRQVRPVCRDQARRSRASCITSSSACANRARGRCRRRVRSISAPAANREGEARTLQPGRSGSAGKGNNPDGMLVGWAPGMSPLHLKPGQAKLIKKGSVLIFQMHYTTNGQASKGSHEHRALLRQRPGRKARHHDRRGVCATW